LNNFFLNFRTNYWSEWPNPIESDSNPRWSVRYIIYYLTTVSIIVIVW